MVKTVNATSPRSVYVVGGDALVGLMFGAQGWNVVTGPFEAVQLLDEVQAVDLVCFTGGADVNPELYGEKNTHSSINRMRDDFEMNVYNQFEDAVPMVGICRGGQFLNVMNGGKLIQHLGKTVSGDVLARRQLRSDMYENHVVRVDHHQGILPTDKADPTLLYLPEMDGLTYACWYPDTKCLCFQPHPEWGHPETHDLFFDLLKEYIG